MGMRDKSLKQRTTKLQASSLVRSAAGRSVGQMTKMNRGESPFSSFVVRGGIAAAFRRAGGGLRWPPRPTILVTDLLLYRVDSEDPRVRLQSRGSG